MVVTDIEWHLSGGNAVTNPIESFGGDISSAKIAQTIIQEEGKEIGTDLLSNLFDRIPGRVAKDGYTDYRIIYVKNADPDRPIRDAILYFNAPDPSVYIRDPYMYVDPPTDPPTKALVPIVADYPYLDTSVGNLSVGILAPKNTSAERLADAETAPTGVDFSAPRLDTDTSLIIGDLDAGDYRAVYVRRIIPPNSAVKNVASWGIEFEYSSPQ